MADQYSDTIRKIDSNDNVTTIAGNAANFGSSDGQGTNATFNNPRGITADARGILFVADQNNDTIGKIDSNDNVTTIAGQVYVQGSSDGQGTNASFNFPTGITADAKGNLYVTDGASGGLIRKIDRNNNVTTIAGGGVATGSTKCQCLRVLSSPALRGALQGGAMALLVTGSSSGREGTGKTLGSNPLAVFPVVLMGNHLDCGSFLEHHASEILVDHAWVLTGASKWASSFPKARMMVGTI